MKHFIQRRLRLAVVLFLLILLSLFLPGCFSQGEEEGEKKELSFTVVPEKEISGELRKLLDKKKEKPFRFSYIDEDSLYIVEGFGEKDSGGYSVVVDQLYLMKQAVYFNALLVGPKEEDRTLEKTCPYIVIKLERREEPVVFL